MKFEEILFGLTILAGLICLCDILLLKPKRKPDQKLPIAIDYARSFLPILVLVFLLRSFLVEPFRIPSGSMKPTLLEGDFILVNKFNYGVRWPLLHWRLYGKAMPKRGDVIVFKHSPSKDLIKRVIGLPGDHILYKDKRLYINGKRLPLRFQTTAYDTDPNLKKSWQVQHYVEDLLGVTHDLYLNDQIAEPIYPYRDFTVPENRYFVMGDNRDYSEDGRFWGFVEDKNVIGQAFRILFSWDTLNYDLRWTRFYNSIE